MSSPNINNAIIVGCILAYVSVILFSVDGERLTRFICKVTILLQNTFMFRNNTITVWTINGFLYSYEKIQKEKVLANMCW